MGDSDRYPDAWIAAVARHPQRVAIDLPPPQLPLTYGNLHAEASEVGEWLTSRDLGPGHFVALRLSDRRRFCAGVLGAWLAGAVPVPLNTDAPASYLDGLERRLGVAASFADKGRVLHPHGAQPRSPSAEGLAYILHTSGSTGRPKPVAMSHQAIGRYCAAFVEATGLGGNDRFLQLAPTSFDVVFEELLPVWSVGGTVVMAEATAADPGRLLETIRHRAVTVAEITTVYWKLLVRHLQSSPGPPPPGLRLLLMGGEMAPVALIRQSLEQALPLAHVYGVTEAGITSTIAFFPPDRPIAGPTVGPPLSNSLVAIVDADGKSVPGGTPGEIWLGGESLAEGYWGDAAETASRFVVASIGAGKPTRWYRTGDAGRLVDGWLEVLGRLDHQVKVNGARVDLTEAEEALRSFPQVIDAAIVPMTRPSAATRLIGFVTAEPHDSPDDLVDDLLRRLRARLPPALVPARIFVLDALPLSPHGKVDRRRLVGDRIAIGSRGLPGISATERMVADAWTMAIGHSPSHVSEGFFDAGGDSLALLWLVLLLEEQGVTVTPLDCLAHPSVRALAAFVDGASPASAEVDRTGSDRRRDHLARRRMARLLPG